MRCQSKTKTALLVAQKKGVDVRGGLCQNAVAGDRDRPEGDRNEKQETIIKATTSWAAINLKTRRPEAVEGLEDGLKSLKEKVAINEKLNKL